MTQNQRSKDLEIMRQARKVFVRHWIDLGRISVRSVSGTIRVRGSLSRLPGYHDELVPQVVESIFKELERIKGGGRVVADLDNWSNDGGLWKSVDKLTAKEVETRVRKRQSSAQGGASGDGGGGTTSIQDDS